MAKKTVTPAQLPLYKTRCTECGSEMDNKYFPLDNLLAQYINGSNSSDLRKKSIDKLRIGAFYGQAVLPRVDPLLVLQQKKDENGFITDRTFRFAAPRLEEIAGGKSRLHCFACENNDIPDNKLVDVELTISSIVAQFYLTTGYASIYEMILLQKQISDLAQISERDEDLEQRLTDLIDEFILLPYVDITALGMGEGRRNEVRAILENILIFAEREAERPDKRHFASEELRIGWRYKLVNGREMPLALAAVGGTTGNSYHCSECCCDKCFSPIPYEMGAYEHRIIGLLGTQASGKTTYLTALTDAIDRGEVTTLVQGGELLRSRLRIEHSLANDPQWKKVTMAAPDRSGEADPARTQQESSGRAGALWLYKHGYPPEKTNVGQGEAPALTFLVRREEQEPIMYTLADIPGEAFYNTVDGKLDDNLVAKHHGLLMSCTSLIMVVSSRQVGSLKYTGENPLDEEEPEEDEEQRRIREKMVKDPSSILACYKAYLPSTAIPTAVVMTAADEINGGNLREALNLAYDIRNLKPLVWSGRENTLFYNAEGMQGACHGVQEFFNREFGGFLDVVKEMLKDTKGERKLSAFAVSSGTQMARYYYTSSKNEGEYATTEQMEARYDRMRQARFGVAAPLLWLMTCDGLLEAGRADLADWDYPSGVRKIMRSKLKNSLYL